MRRERRKNRLALLSKQTSQSERIKAKELTKKNTFHFNALNVLTGDVITITEETKQTTAMDNLPLS